MEERPNKRALFVLAFVLVIVLVVVTGWGTWIIPQNQSGTSSAVTGGGDQPGNAIPLTADSASAVAKQVAPATAYIEAKQTDATGGTIQTSVGTGIIIHNDGHIVTNYHVIEGASSIKVTLMDGRSFDAQSAGQDPWTDLAMIKITADNLTVATLGSSDSLSVGDWVIAIGNAFALQGGPTVSFGVVSAVHRSVTEPDGVILDDLIQTDAAINPGNSGGPLVNLNGEVVGIDTAGLGDNAKVGFAISIDNAKSVINELHTYGHVVRPYLGLGLMTLTPAVAAQSNLPVNQGLYVVKLYKDSPAGQAGVASGDIIIAFGGQKVLDTRQYWDVDRQHKVGDVVDLQVLRGGKQLTIEIKLTQTPPTP
jgi:serine protease Do